MIKQKTQEAADERAEASKAFSGNELSKLAEILSNTTDAELAREYFQKSISRNRPRWFVIQNSCASSCCSDVVREGIRLCVENRRWGELAFICLKQQNKNPLLVAYGLSQIKRATKEDADSALACNDTPAIKAILDYGKPSVVDYLKERV